MPADHSGMMDVSHDDDCVILQFTPGPRVALSPEWAITFAQSLMRHAYQLQSSRLVAEEPSLIQEIPT